MSGDMKTNVLLTLKDQFSQGIKAAGSATQSFASGAVKAIQGVDKAFSGLATAAGAIGVSLSLGSAAKQIIELDDTLNAFGVQAGISADSVANLKQQIFDTANAPDIKLDTASITDALGRVVEMTGDMEFATDNMEGMARAIRATGASGSDIGGLFSEFQKMGLSADEAAIALDTLTIQGKEGAFTLENLAALGPRTINAYTATGRSGADALREMGAALQVIRMGTGSSEQAATAFEAVMRTLTSPDKQKKLRQLGVTVRDQEGNFKSITDIMKETIAAADGSTETLGMIFDSEAMRAFNFAISEYKRTGAVESMDKFNSMLGDGNTIQADAARRAQTLKANIQGLQTAFVKFADSKLTAPLQKLTDALNKLAEDPDAYQRIFTGIAVGLGAIAAIKLSAGIINFVSNLSNIKNGNINLSAGGSNGAGIPVHVTNWGGASGSSPLSNLKQNGTGSNPTANTSAGSGGGLKNMGKAATTAVKGLSGKQLAMGGVATGAVALVTEIPQMIGELNEIKNNDELSDKEKTVAKGGAIGDATGSVVGAVAGGVGGVAAGAAVGAAVGSVVPVLGTAVGALVGAGIGALGMWLGGKAGRAVGEGIGSAVANGKEKKAVQESATQHGMPEEVQNKLQASAVPPQYITNYSNTLEIPSYILPSEAHPSHGEQYKGNAVDVGGEVGLNIALDISGAQPVVTETAMSNMTGGRIKYQLGSTSVSRSLQ